jgi:hypothetical protein
MSLNHIYRVSDRIGIGHNPQSMANFARYGQAQASPEYVRPTCKYSLSYADSYAVYIYSSISCAQRRESGSNHGQIAAAADSQTERGQSAALPLVSLWDTETHPDAFKLVNGEQRRHHLPHLASALCTPTPFSVFLQTAIHLSVRGCHRRRLCLWVACESGESVFLYTCPLFGIVVDERRMEDRELSTLTSILVLGGRP